MIAAAPGETLPLFPAPLHTFAGPEITPVSIDGRKYVPTNSRSRSGAPRRALTVWDAISDLPPIPSGYDSNVSRYLHQPLSHLQQLFRHQNDVFVDDHVSKDVNPLCQERINRIPKTPGSDWRDLPNISGARAKKLRYPQIIYNKQVGILLSPY